LTDMNTGGQTPANAQEHHMILLKPLVTQNLHTNLNS